MTANPDSSVPIVEHIPDFEVQTLPAPAVEKRSAQRSAVNWRCAVLLKGARQPDYGRLKDISEAGCCMLCHNHPPEGADCDLYVEAIRDGEILRLVLPAKIMNVTLAGNISMFRLGLRVHTSQTADGQTYLRLVRHIQAG